MNRRLFLRAAPFGMTLDCFAQQQKKLPERDIRVVKTGQQAPPTSRDIVTTAGRGRKALCVGINGYTAVTRLNNAVNDAAGMNEALGKYRFQSALQTDSSLAPMTRSIAQFSASIAPGDVAFFFFAGHGVQIGGTNYLIPSDFRPTNEADIATHAIAVDRVMAQIGQARPSLAVMLLDACRNNPFRPANGGAGLAPVPPVLGTMTVFATGAGRTASDNPNSRNGLFTGRFLSAMPDAVPLQTMARKVRDEVFASSSGQQRPYIQEDVVGDFYFQNAGQQTATPVPPTLETPGSGRQSIDAGLQAYRTGDYAKALQAFETAARENPESAPAWNAVGATYAQMGQLARAVEMYAKAIRIAPGYVAAYVNRGLAFLSVPKYELAAQDFSWAIEEDKENPQLLLWRGQSYLGMRQFEQALEDLDASLTIDAGSPEAFRFRGKVEHRMAKFDQALQDYGIAIQLRKTYWQAYEDRGATLAAMGRTNEAKADRATATRLRGVQ